MYMHFIWRFGVASVGQYLEKVVPRFCMLLKEGKPVTIHGPGTQKRSFLYAQDFVDAVLCVMEKGQVGKVYNISSRDEISVLNLAHHIAAVMGLSTFQIQHVVDRCWQDTRYLCRSDPLHALGWSQKVSFKDGLKKTVDWYMHEMPPNYFVEPYVIPYQVPLELKGQEVPCVTVAVDPQPITEHDFAHDAILTQPSSAKRQKIGERMLSDTSK